MKIFLLSEDGTIEEASGDLSRIFSGGLSVALGRFDGVHKGHQALLRATLKGDLTRAVWTFLQSDRSPLYIIPTEKRLSIFGKLGIKIAICEDFERVKDYSPERFVSYLVETFSAKNLVCGYDFRFGINRSGNAETLQKIAAKYDTGAEIVQKIDCDDLAVSSTNIRKMLLEGDVDGASKMLGRQYSLTSEVVVGRKVGHRLGVPTINQKFAHGQLIPRHGVYFSTVEIDRKSYQSVTNIGVRPTFNDSAGEVTCESHIIGVTDDFYGKMAEVTLYHFAREERVFPDTGSLLSAILGDIERCKEYFSRK